MDVGVMEQTVAVVDATKRGMRVTNHLHWSAIVFNHGDVVTVTVTVRVARAIPIAGIVVLGGSRTIGHGASKKVTDARQDVTKKAARVLARDSGWLCDGSRREHHHLRLLLVVDCRVWRLQRLLAIG